MKRQVIIKHNDDTPVKVLNIKKATLIRTQKQMIVFEKMDDDNWRLTYSEGTIPDFSKVKEFKVERENGI